MHKLKIESKEGKTKILLDNFELQNVSTYELVSSAKGRAELTIKIIISDQKVEI